MANDICKKNIEKRMQQLFRLGVSLDMGQCQ